MPSSTWTTSLGEPERFLSLPLILPQRPKTRFASKDLVTTNFCLSFLFQSLLVEGKGGKQGGKYKEGGRSSWLLPGEPWKKNIHNLSTSTSVDGGVEEKRQSWILSRQHLLLSMFHHGGPGGLKLRRPLIASFIKYYIGGCQEGDDVDGRQARQDWKGPPHTANTSPNR